MPRLQVPVDALSNISLYLDVVEEGPAALYDELRMLYQE